MSAAAVSTSVVGIITSSMAAASSVARIFRLFIRHFLIKQFSPLC